MKKKIIKESSSFRDPSGQVFYQDREIYRQVNNSYKDDYDLLIKSGLYQRLVKEKLLISHQEINPKQFASRGVYKVIKPQLIPFISYPYEWCFSQLKDTALVTLKIQKIAFEYGMSLKDASAYNLQFLKGQPILIDTLSFEKHEEGKPWVAYRQFCQHFLAPLALMSLTDVRLNQLLKVYLDGLPLDLVVKLLPKKTWFNLSLLAHLHLHAKSQKHLAGKKVSLQQRRMKTGNQAFVSLINNLEATIKKLDWRETKTEWQDYYSATNYSRKAFAHKKQLVKKYLNQVKPDSVWDLGANTGEFSRLALKRRVQVMAFDFDPNTVEKNYLQVRKKKEKNLLPLLFDLTNPSPSLGWANEERKSLKERGPAAMVLALALVHHLAISNNLPLGKIAQFFHQIGKSLIIEFVPKTDSQVQRLLLNREDIFTDYTQANFEKEFKRFFTLQEKSVIKDSQRILYLMT
ncbi:MAG TPA: SAM-dependent methyltransferase [Patescibacteria group bacterium]|nr:SAM-dependent methyltransferase [Patescibacteria group bacterium]